MKLTNREKIIRFKSYYQKTKCGLCEALCISKVTLIFIYMKSKKKKNTWITLHSLLLRCKKLIYELLKRKK